MLLDYFLTIIFSSSIAFLVLLYLALDGKTWSFFQGTTEGRIIRALAIPVSLLLWVITRENLREVVESTC